MSLRIRLLLVLPLIATCSAHNFCFENEEYVCGPVRDINCENLGDDPIDGVPCVQKCHCLQEFAKNATGHCVSVQHCTPRQCPLNAEYDDCGPKCHATCGMEECENDGQCYDGCFCRVGYVLDEEGGKCIKQEDCSNGARAVQICPANEILDQCYNGNEQTCTGWESPISPPVGPCLKKCVCQYGFIRATNGTCVEPEKYCECPTNEHYECGSPCQTECNALGEFCDIISFQCTPGCYCDEGYARGGQNMCVQFNDCPADVCPEGEEYQECGTACPQTCTKPEIQSCPHICNPACFCQAGYLRAPNGICIPEDLCYLTLDDDYLLDASAHWQLL